MFFPWFCANRGSKFWQKNWEKHVGQLEDKVTGPLYKIILARNKPASIRKNV
ncbi:RipA family octameric membrane protein [Halomonas sp. MES3-P3E]|uniref:RipA family octameric membrane protein n=1 Tax=Halomonas sp. MES3-P3E TaxID=2058321 RepID=UPI003FA5B0F1